MAAQDPVIERIAQELARRVALVKTSAGYQQTLSVVRPAGTDRDVAPLNNRAVIYQNDPDPDEEHSAPGNPPLVAFRQLFLVFVYIRPSEAVTVAIDTLINRAAADVVKAVRNTDNWHTFAGNAFNSRIWPTSQFEHEDGEHDGIVVPFEVWYRHREDDPYTAG